MSVYVIRSGAANLPNIDELENYTLRECRLSIHFSLMEDVFNFDSQIALRDYLLDLPEHYSESLQSAAQVASQVWRFANEIQGNDMAVLPLHSADPRVVAVGRIASDYDFLVGLALPNYSARPYRAVGPHVRNLNWLTTDVPRQNFDQELEGFLKRRPTVYQITAEDAENRIQQIVDDHLEQE